jgi:hypothetical protein
MTQKIDLDRVREINPVREAPDDPEAAERLLRRVLVQPRRPARRRRRAAFRVAAVAATAAVAAAGVALWPSSGESPDVIASAAAALTEPDTILQFKTRSNHKGSTEEWRTSDGRQSHILHDTGKLVLEYVLDFDKGIWDSYVPARNEIQRYAPKGGLAQGPSSVDTRASGAIDTYDNLEELLERARDGKDNVHLVGEARIRDIPTYELRMDFTVEFADGRRAATRTLHIDRERFLPVRLVEHISGSPFTDVTDYLEVERLPRTPENERFLQMSPHPGAKLRVIEKI